MTDLERSTMHVRALGDDYGSVLARHHEIIQRAICDHDGTEVGSEGDSFAAVFPGCASAVQAAVEAQRGLLAVSWPDGAWRVRMAIHAGPVVIGEAGAVGLALHEAARVRALSAGGQILLSAVAREGLGTVPTPEILVTDLGTHVIRDFALPTHLFQVTAPGLPRAFPPPRSLGTRPVPTGPTPFLGRASELDDLVSALEHHRLVTVTGFGGSGKTRLAFEAARLSELASVAVIELAGLRTGDQVTATVARTVGAPNPEALPDTIGDVGTLLVLDNCEHLIDAVGPLVSTLLASCPALTVLATSREPLHLSGEVVWPIPSLTQYEAAALFRSLVAATLDEALVGTACERLGRIPLAIELAAARARSMALSELVARLDDQLALLTTGARDASRHRTMGATLDWSYELLSEEERTVFRRFGVFAGTFSMDAIEEITDERAMTVLDAVDGLVSKSLLEFNHSTGRYHLLEPVRQYALARLGDGYEHDRARDGHLRWALNLSRQANRRLFTEQRKWTTILDAERENLGAAIGWALDHDRISEAASIVSALSYYWFTSGRQDSFVWVPRLLDHIDELDDHHRGLALLAAGRTYCDSPGDDRSVDWLIEAEQILRQVGNDRALAAVLFWLGRAAGIRSVDQPPQMQLAERVLGEAVPLQERLGDRLGWGWSRLWQGILARLRGDGATAAAIFWEVIDRCQDVPHVLAGAWENLGEQAGVEGDFGAADAHFAHAIELFDGIGDRWQVAIARRNRASFQIHVDRDRAARLMVEAIAAEREVGADSDLHVAALGAAYLLAWAGRMTEAATLRGAVTSAHLATLAFWFSLTGPDGRSLESALLSTALSTQRERGRRLGIRDASDAALSWLPETYGPADDSAQPNSQPDNSPQSA
jgi:predicted ATPase/class 3 adenylate cyclase